MRSKYSSVRALGSLRVPSVLCSIALAAALSAQAQEVFKLDWQESGIQDKNLGYRPHSLLLETKAPEGLKQPPTGTTNPYYGVLELGPPKSKAKLLVLVDVTNGAPAHFYLDSNGNGDFTDDPPCVSTNRPAKDRQGNTVTAWQGEGMVTFPFASGTRTGKLKFYSLRPVLSAEGESRMALNYYADYGLVGDVKIDGRSIPVVLQDAAAAGCFRLDQDPMLNPLLYLLVTNPGTRHVGIGCPVQRPFELDGKWWAVTNLTLDGAFQIVASAKPAPRKEAAKVDLSPGKKAPAFTGKLLDGKTVKFPDDYKGKVVLVDFWATWCGPCVAELPNVVKAYGKYHEQGLEILGISLDKEDWEQKLAEFTKKRNMPWPQVYDGKYWGAEVAGLYGIDSIPHMLLVDGDSGVILADKTIRGENLAPAIEEALAKRKK
jgi:peroxiredoxin